MSKKTIPLAAAIPVALTVLALGVPSAQAQGKGIVASASGSGQVTSGDDVRTFAFTAQRDSTNTTRGEGEVINRDLGTRAHLKINCLHVAGNVATMSGVFTNSNTEGAPFGDGHPFWFRVVDNGEGKNAPPDLISLLVGFFGGSVPCTSNLAPADIPIEGGNIQVR